MLAVRRILISILITLAAAGFFWPFFVPSDEMADNASWFFLAATPFTLLLILVLVTQEELGSK
jgi:hypothetical protein